MPEKRGDVTRQYPKAPHLPPATEKGPALQPRLRDRYLQLVRIEHSETLRKVSTRGNKLSKVLIIAIALAL
jgi:hypothetical protein